MKWQAALWPALYAYIGDVVQEEVRRRERIVAIDDEAVLMCPYASSHPFALMLAPRRRRERFEAAGPTGAALLHKGLRLLREHLGDPLPLSLWIRTAPRDAAFNPPARCVCA